MAQIHGTTINLKEKENLKSLTGLKNDIKNFSEKFILPGI